MAHPPPLHLDRPVPRRTRPGRPADLDATTDVAATRRTARQYRGATFLKVPNMGHVAEYDPSGCVAGLTSGFLRHGKLGDTACLAEIPPLKVEPVKGSNR
ncbi:alpha/beta hydrolase [Nonomuraea endophytica]|uniref:alpha/beta hydrolase n=1 Tax=Nonomuraea endophytica TaxID=714136 RepID=UPI0037C85852